MHPVVLPAFNIDTDDPILALGRSRSRRDWNVVDPSSNVDSDEVSVVNAQSDRSLRCRGMVSQMKRKCGQARCHELEARSSPPA